MVSGSSTADLFTHTFYYSTETEANRNYTVCYDKKALTTLWVAYPIASKHLGSVDRTDDWSYVSSSLLAESLQPSVPSGSFYDRASGGSNNFARGHILPSASRTASTTMNQQTFLSVNIVPQIHDNFNGGVWMYLEDAIRSRVKAGEEIYVVTGTMCPQANDGNGSFTMEATYDKSGKKIPAPRYFYKVVLKVSKSGSTVTSANAIGFWFTNKAHAGANYYDSTFVKSVDQIESLTGLDFFVNLPDNVEVSAEANKTVWWN